MVVVVFALLRHEVDLILKIFTYCFVILFVKIHFDELLFLA